MKSFQTYYERAEREWRVLVAEAVPDYVVENIRTRLIAVNVDRLLAISKATQPDRYAFVEQAIEDLKAFRIAQVVVSKGDVVAFKANARMTSAAFSIPGVSQR